MHPITHLLTAWTFADLSGLKGRDRKLVALSGLLPDLDGAGMIVDAMDAALGRPVMWYYGQYHHLLLHGLPGAFLLSLLLAPFGINKARTLVFAFLSIHIHLLADLVGSRGPDPDDLWPIHYLAPFQDQPAWVPSWQWPLNSWPNVVVTVLLLAFAFHRAIRAGYSPVELLGKRAEEVFIKTVQNRFRGD